MDLIGILTAIGLAAPAGLNAYLALLIVGLAGRFTGLIQLAPPLDLLTNTWVLLVLALLLGVEVFADKIPAVDTINDLIGTLIRPVAGAILALAGTQALTLDPVLAAIIGLVAAGSMHAIKATSRPAVTVLSGGLANPAVSMVEDILAAAGLLLTLVAPVVGGLLVLGLLLGLWWLAAWGRRCLRALGGGQAQPGR